MDRPVVDASPGWSRARTLGEHLPFLVLLVVAGALYVSTLDSYGMFIWDEAEYASIGRSVLRGEGFAINGRPNSLRPPVLPLAGAASMWLTGRANDRSARLATVALALLALAIVYAAAAVAYDPPTGFLAAALLAAAPSFWTMTAMFLSELPFMGFFAGAVLWFELGLRRDPRYFWPGWFCAALALLTRYTAVLYVLYLVARIAVVLWKRGDELRRLRSRSSVLAVCAASVLVIAWLIRQQVVFGTFLVGFAAASTQLQLAQVFFPPWHYYLANLPALLSPVTTGALAIGIAWGVWRRDGLTLTCALVIAGIVGWFSAYRYKELRLITSIMPFAAIVGAVGLMAVLPGVRSRRYGWGVLALFAALVFGATYPAVRTAFTLHVPRGYPVLLRSMHVLVSESEPGAMVMTTSPPQVFWYTGRRVMPFPERERLAAALAACDWVMFASFQGSRPYVRELAKTLPATGPPGSMIRVADPSGEVLLVRASYLREQL